MREYETTLIIQPEISDEGRDALVQKLDALVASNGGVRLAVDDVGKRKLAYEIAKFQKGHYLTLQFLDQARGSAVKELERQLRIEESVLRFLTVMVSPEVLDVEARKVEAAEQERVRKQRAAERAAREAEEERAREAAEREARSAAGSFAAARDEDDAADDASDEED